MSVSIALTEFAGALALISLSSWVLTGQIERIAAKFHFAPGLLGLAVAFGADSPEISAAVSALAGGNEELGVGVVLGSNIFNIAALLGVSSLFAQRGIRVGRRALLLSGAAALGVTLLAALLVLRWLPGWLVLILATLVLAAYAVGSTLDAAHLERLGVPVPIRRYLQGAAEDVERCVGTQETIRPATTLDCVALVPSITAVVFGSVVLVNRAETLADTWSLPHTLVGVLLLAALTGIPNLVGSIHLARRGRGNAVVSEALNSNSLNVVFGLCLPAVAVGLSRGGTIPAMALAWLVGMTVVAIVLAGRGKTLRKRGGGVLIALYVCFVVAVVLVAA